ncbi:MAG: hypothetical protein JRH20_13565 [Deltaproteobacteria bacterium]|nr:hypothetical protein [Deltaproteobacteria bacterium]
MKLDANDPRLTAYVLGELDDAERQKIEAAMASWLSSVLGEMPKSEGLDAERRAALEARLEKSEAQDNNLVDLAAARRRRMKVIVPIAAAASVLLAVGLGSVAFMTGGQKAGDVVGPEGWGRAQRLSVKSVHSSGAKQVADSPRSSSSITAKITAPTGSVTLRSATPQSSRGLGRYSTPTKIGLGASGKGSGGGGIGRHASHRASGMRGRDYDRGVSGGA